MTSLIVQEFLRQFETKQNERLIEIIEMTDEDWKERMDGYRRNVKNKYLVLDEFPHYQIQLKNGKINKNPLVPRAIARILLRISDERFNRWIRQEAPVPEKFPRVFIYDKACYFDQEEIKIYLDHVRSKNKDVSVSNETTKEWEG